MNGLFYKLFKSYPFIMYNWSTKGVWEKTDEIQTEHYLLGITVSTPREELKSVYPETTWVLQLYFFKLMIYFTWVKPDLIPND